MKMKEFGPGGGRVPGAPPLDPPMHCNKFVSQIDLTDSYKRIADRLLNDTH